MTITEEQGPWGVPHPLPMGVLLESSPSWALLRAARVQ